MQWLTIGTPPFKTLEQFDAVREQHLGTPDGVTASYVGTVDGNLRIITVWESKDHADRFFTETLGPALAKALGPEPVGAPELVGMAVARSYAREAVA